MKGTPKAIARCPALKLDGSAPAILIVTLADSDGTANLKKEQQE